MKKFLAILGSALMGLMLATAASAAPENVLAEVTFATAITIVENNPMQIGVLDVAMAVSDTVTINTDDSFSESASNVIGGTQAAADLTITATESQPITISVGNVSAATNYALGTWMCNYDGAGSDSACFGGYSETTPAASTTATLLIGVTLTGNGAAVAGNDDSTFDVTVTYQ
jgi:hypothetical protein